ncbi:hypothetical protein BDV40DRAFT_296236 [Aspergillus tamarii]|uniref:Uncharacterized protein n=1 Tax=Aspergillus tamarii TaxID=41984 RepID=A0A5N6V7U1_ASPTM|nr:hypothetical protein BDV40DRAFT_296236 [Aspergillus tamarii]
MKFAYILSALASTAIGAPALGGLSGLSGLTSNLPVVNNLLDLNGLVGGILGGLIGSLLGGGSSGDLPLGTIIGFLGQAPAGTTGVIPSGLPSTIPTPSTGAVPSVVPSAAPATGPNSGKLVQDLAPQLNNILVVTGPNAQLLLIQLSPEVTALVAGLGLPQLAAPLGGVVAAASSVGVLVKDLGPAVQNVVTVVGKDGGALLIQLSPQVAGLVSGLGLPQVGVPVGTVIAIVGKSL